MNKLNLFKILRKYPSGWVSISNDYKKVIASGKTLKILLSRLEKMGKPKGYIMKASPDYSGYVG